MEDRVAKMWQAYTEEHAKDRGFEQDLTENHKKIRMLSKGTKDLDQLLSFGQQPKANWGLGYNGKEFVSTVFVHGKEPLKEQVTITEHGECSGPKNPKVTQVTTGQVSTMARTQEIDSQEETS